MSDQPENIMLVYLRRLDAKVDQVIETLTEQGQRLTALEIAVGNLAATEMSHYGITAARVDRLEKRLERIERRLDLTETA
jgi:hypothetical protein